MKRVIPFLLALLLLVGMAVPAVYAEPSAKSCKRAIGIVFDNSGSMYIQNGKHDYRKLWCRATYATEVFASMMNAGDILQVYPMNPITVGDKEYTYEQPLTIDQASASTIRQIYSPKPGDTHIETITAACNGIMQTDADEKWVVVLTDGDEFYRNGQGLGTGKGTIKALEEDLSACAAQLNVMYLGMGAVAAMPENVTGNYYYEAQKSADSTEVLSALSKMCNTIFGRDSLPEVGSTVKFDLPMKKLILFVQGQGIQNVKLGDLSPVSSTQMQYSTLGAGGNYAKLLQIDDTLQGMMAIYENVDAAELALSHDGTATSVDCYYEPDVDIWLELQDAAGNKVDPNAELICGTYMLGYGIVDKNGNMVNSPLLGKTVYELTYTQAGKEETITTETGDILKLELKPGDTLSARVKATYLDGYTLERDTKDEWPEGGLSFIAPEAGLLEIRLSGGAEEYKLSGLAAGEPYRVSFIYEGAELTGSQLDTLEELQAVLDGGNAQCTLDRDDNGYYVTFAPYEVSYETDCTDYELQVSAIYRNENDKRTNRALATAAFKVTDDSRNLDMKVSAPQSYYQLSKISESQPITLKLYYSGDALTEEELNGITVTAECEGVTLLQEKDPQNSAVVLRLDPANPPAEGKYRVYITATGINEIGREQTCDGRVHIEVGALPKWLKILIPILAILLIIGLIVAFLNMKVLPKGVKLLPDMRLVVDGDVAAGNGSAMLIKLSRTKGVIEVSSPTPITPGMKQKIKFEITALSNRMTPSKKRKYEITKVTVAGNVKEYTVKGMAYTRGENGFQNAMGKQFSSVQAGPKVMFALSADNGINTATFQGSIQNV